MFGESENDGHTLHKINKTHIQIIPYQYYANVEVEHPDDTLVQWRRQRQYNK
jgi:hypothetical protein